ncbi:MAG: hypothetical protein GY765_21695 [bacterium]|nr:hypothetical protein [bacterium]
MMKRVFSSTGRYHRPTVTTEFQGGTVINIVDEMRIPVKFIGTGETAEDIEPFSVDDFIDSVLSE